MSKTKKLLIYVIIALFYSLLYSLLSAALLSADTLKPILVVADDYGNDSDGMVEASNEDYRKILSFLIMLNKKKIIKVAYPTLLRGKKANVNNVIKAIKNIKTNKNDVLLFHIISHGGIKNNRSYFRLCDHRFLYRSTVSTLIKQKSARFKIIVSEVCSHRNKMGTLSGVSRFGPDTIPEPNLKNLLKLFYLYKGTFHITSSSKGEPAWANPITGSLFSWAFIDDTLYHRTPETWKQVAIRSKNLTNQYFQQFLYSNLSADEKNRLQRTGIHGQHPVVYSFPIKIKTADKRFNNLLHRLNSLNDEKSLLADSKKGLKQLMIAGTKLFNNGHKPWNARINILWARQYLLPYRKNSRIAKTLYHMQYALDAIRNPHPDKDNSTIAYQKVMTAINILKTKVRK